MHLSAWATAGLVLAALAAGLVDAVAGGSGVIAVPALLAAGLPPHLALGTNKAQGVFGTCASTLRYARAGLLDPRRARVTFPAGLAGSLCGAALVLLVPPSTLRPMVLVLLIAVAVALALRPSAPTATATPTAILTPTSTATPTSPSTWARRAPRLAAAAVALLLGAYDGFFGPGAGTFLILAFAFLFDLPLQRASADAKPVNFASNLAALALFSARGAVLWEVALPMAAAQFAGGWLGAHLAVRGGDRLVRALVLLVVLALVAKLATDMVRAAH
ncbi:MAG TPA: TSUP family transporter [Myxococcales bacterium]|nr:TSUP family transporter [Myxococcales bacterium]